MDYQNDTLTNAIRNRAASRKLFEHWNANPQPLGCPSTTRMASLTASNPSKFSSQHNRHFALSQDTQPSPPSQPMTTNLTNGAAAATSFESNGVVGQQQQPNILLHRSPSGAQRKIRQKAQQQQQNGIGGFGGPNNAQNNAQQQQQQQMAYRNLIRENGYRSILGDEGARTADPSAPRSLDPALSVGQLIDRMNRLEPFPKSIDSSWLQSAGGSIDKMPPMASQLDGQPSSAFPLSSKPTVQVHPLPVPPRHRSMSVISSCSFPSQKPIPPPLPPKKHSLMASQFGIPNKRNIQTNLQNHEESTQILSGPHWQSSVLSSSQSSFSHSQSSSAETEFPGFHSSKQQLTDEKDNPSQHFVEEVGDKKGRSQSIGQKPTAEPRKDGRRIGPKQPNHLEHKIANPSPFFSPPPSLSSSPSLASLQNSLHFAIENPEKHSWEQLQELDQRRLQSIDSLGKKVAEREQDRQLLCRDLEEIGQLKTVLFARISQNRHNSDLLNRLDIFLAEMEKMTDLETYLHCQLARLRETNKLAKKEELENGWIEGERAEWVKRLREQINDLHFLGGMLASRERNLDAEMAEELGDAEALNEWIFYKEQLGKLSVEKRQLEERLRDVRNLIDSLQAICLLCPQKLD